MRAVGNQSFSMLSGAVEGTTVDLILSVSLFSFDSCSSEHKRDCAHIGCAV